MALRDIELDFCLTTSKIWFEYIMYHPEDENRIFNELLTPINILNHAYWYLLRDKLITPIEKMDSESKINLKTEVLRLSPNRSVDNGMKIARSIIVLGYISNI